MGRRNLIGASMLAVLAIGLAHVSRLGAATRRKPVVPVLKERTTEAPTASAKGDTAKVTAVRFWSLGDVTRVSIETSASFKFRSERIVNPERVFFDIADAKPALEAAGAPGKKGMNVIAVGDSVLKQIRVAETLPGKTRIVLDLEGKPEFTASQLTNPDRLIIEIRSPDRGGPSVAPSVSRGTRLRDVPTREIAADISSHRAPPPIERVALVESKVERKTASAPLLDPRNNFPESAMASPAATAPEPKKPAKVFEPPPGRAERKPEVPQPELLPPAELPRLAKPTRSAPGSSAQTPPVLTAGISRNDRAALKSPPDARTPELKEASRGYDPLPAKRNANGERSLTRVLGLKLGRVVIDAGHGGHDRGTAGPSGLTEKELVLDVAHKLGDLLEERLGSAVFYTREDDTFISLEDRTRFANDHKADLFLSIHANASPLKTAAGVETYYLNFTTSKSALEVAARENASSSQSIYDLGDLLKKIALKDKVDESREFATKIQNSLFATSLKNNTTARNRGVKKAPFVVLIGANMPSVLVEIGFLSNTADEALMKRSDHRMKIAEALYKGVSGYAGTLSHFDVAKRD